LTFEFLNMRDQFNDLIMFEKLFCLNKV